MTTIQHMPTAAEREQELAENAYRLVRAVESGSGLVRARPEVLAALAGIARGLAELVELVDTITPEPNTAAAIDDDDAGSAEASLEVM